MSEFVCEHIGPRKFARCSETRSQFIEETQVDVDFLIAWTIKRPSGRLSVTTRRLDRIPKQHQLWLLIWLTARRKYFAPRILRIGQQEVDKLHHPVFGGR